MKGNNEIRVNKATMLEAVNLWLKSEFKAAPVAIDVCENRENGRSSASPDFIIRVESSANTDGNGDAND